MIQTEAGLPLGGVIVSLGMTQGFGYQPLVSGGTSVVSGLGTISSITLETLVLVIVLEFKPSSMSVFRPTVMVFQILNLLEHCVSGGHIVSIV